MAKKTKPKVGDIFRIPLSETRAGFGQILADYEKEMLLMVIYSIEASGAEVPPLQDIVASEPVFIANSMDAKIWHGDWVIVGNLRPDVARFPLPKYKVRIGDQMHVESYDGANRRLASESEVHLLSFRKCVSPQVLEDAIQAHWGLFPQDQFDAAQLVRLKASFQSMKADLALQAARISI
jgi:hypothetical protein